MTSLIRNKLNIVKVYVFHVRLKYVSDRDWGFVLSTIVVYFFHEQKTTGGV